MKKAIITGVTGQDGIFLAKLLQSQGYQVIGITRSYTNSNKERLRTIFSEEELTLEECDLLDISSILKLLNKYNPDEFYNLAAQSSVGLSFEQPIGTMHFNTISVLNILESIRLVNKRIKFYQASSSEMFGKVTSLPITEYTPMHPLSPYAISKASAYWLVVNYRESYGLFASNGILFNHESALRSENFFIKKVILESVKILNGKQDGLRVGNIDIKRDFGYAPEYVKAMYLMMQAAKPDDFVICSGQSISLREIIYHVFNRLGIDKSRLIIDENLYRPTEIEDIYGDNTKAKEKLGWNYNTSFFEVLDKLIDFEIELFKSEILE